MKKEKPLELAYLAEKALKEAVKRTILDHQKTGDPLVIWRNGKVLHVSADSLLKKKSA